MNSSESVVFIQYTSSSSDLPCEDDDYEAAAVDEE